MKHIASGIIKFNEVNKDGTLYKSGCIIEKDLFDLKADGEITDYEIDKDGVKVIKDIKLHSVSVTKKMNPNYFGSFNKPVISKEK